MAHKLNFRPGTQRNRKLKANPDKYKLSDGRPNINYLLEYRRGASKILNLRFLHILHLKNIS